MQNLVVVSHTVCVHVGPKIREMLRPHPKDEGVAVPLETRSYPTRYHIKFGRSMSNRLGVDMGYQQFWRTLSPTLSMGSLGDPLEWIYATTPRINTPNFVALGQTIWA